LKAKPCVPMNKSVMAVLRQNPDQGFRLRAV